TLTLLQAVRRPGHTLVSLWHSLHALVNEFLNAFAFVGLGCVDVVLGVGCNAVRSIELTWLTSAATEADQHFQRLTIQYVDLEVLTVGQVDVLLFRIVGEGDIPG